jgi:hypothetical protein
MASGNAGSVAVNAPQITITKGAEIASTTAGTGAGGSVSVTTTGMLALDGSGVANTQITASATGPQSGSGGSVTVAANSLKIDGGAQIASSTTGPGNSGDVEVRIGGDVILSGVTADGTESGITASALPGSSGQAGKVVLAAGGALALSSGAEVSSSTVGTGSGGNVQIAAQGPLTLADPKSGIITLAMTAASGGAGSMLAEAGRGGLPPDPEATLPALYIAGRDLSPNSQTNPGTAELSGAPVHTTARLAMHCN